MLSPWTLISQARGVDPEASFIFQGLGCWVPRLCWCQRLYHHVGAIIALIVLVSAKAPLSHLYESAVGDWRVPRAVQLENQRPRLLACLRLECRVQVSGWRVIVSGFRF